MHEQRTRAATATFKRFFRESWYSSPEPGSRTAPTIISSEKPVAVVAIGPRSHLDMVQVEAANGEPYLVTPAAPFVGQLRAPVTVASVRAMTGKQVELYVWLADGDVPPRIPTSRAPITDTERTELQAADNLISQRVFVGRRTAHILIEAPAVASSWRLQGRRWRSGGSAVLEPLWPDPNDGTVFESVGPAGKLTRSIVVDVPGQERYDELIVMAKTAAGAGNFGRVWWDIGGERDS